MNMPTILFVCTGNTCRSPMAEAFANALFSREGIAAHIHSAGVSTGDGYPASQHAIHTMAQELLDIGSHQSKQVTKEMLQESTVVLAMTAGHLRYVKTLCPTAKAFTLGDYVMGTGDVSDPFGGDLDTYHQCATQIKQLLINSMAKLKEDLM